jgi:Meiotically up-regulated gene 113
MTAAPQPWLGRQFRRTVTLMGYVYAFRHGHEDEFKFGQTINLDQRRKALQTGCPKPLALFDWIETDDYKNGEKFILRRLAHKRLIGEFRAVTADEAREAMDACRAYLENELPRWREEDHEVDELSTIESDPEMLPSNEDVLEKHRQLLRLRAEKNFKKIEIDRLEAEEARLETAIKLAIGRAKGIEGVATWETGDSRRAFNSEALKAMNPELYEMYLTKFDQTRFRMERPDEYVSYQQTSRIRHFRLVEDS